MEKNKDFIQQEEVEAEDYEINELLACELLDNNEVAIHVEYAKDMPLSKKLRLLREGFLWMAKHLENNPDFVRVGLVTATSWIVAEHPGLMERLGFTVSNEGEDYKRHTESYKAKNRKINRLGSKMLVEPGYAYITKDKFISLYGGDDK